MCTAQHLLMARSRESASRRNLPRKSPKQLLNEYKVLKRLRTQQLVADDLELDRSVYFELRAGRKVKCC
jgi:hypothetical protein